MSGQPDISQWNLQIRTSEEPSHRLLGPRHYPALIKKDLAAVREERGENVRAIICFDCGQISFASEKEEASKCNYCGLEMKMGDMAFCGGGSSEQIITQGEVHVTGQDCFTAPGIMCRNLMMDTCVSSPVYCLGELKINCSGIFAEPLQANTISVAPEADVTFLAAVRARNLIVEGKVTGNVVCEGKIFLKPGGKLIGDAVASKMEKEPGSVHKGKCREIYLPE